MAFQQDTVADVRKLVVSIMEDAWLVNHSPNITIEPGFIVCGHVPSKTDPELMHRVIPMLAYMLKDNNPNVLKRVLACFIQLYRIAFRHIAAAKASNSDLQEIWDVCIHGDSPSAQPHVMLVTIYLYCCTHHLSLLLHTPSISTAPHTIYLYCSTHHLSLLLHIPSISTAPHTIYLYCSTHHLSLLLHTPSISTAPHTIYLYCSTYHLSLLLHIPSISPAPHTIYLYCSTIYAATHTNSLILVLWTFCSSLFHLYAPPPPVFHTPSYISTSFPLLSL